MKIFLLLTPAFLAAALTLPARADIIELTNGDRYQGSVIGMNATNVQFQSEIQGRVNLPRNKVARIILHDVVTPKPVASTNAAAGQSLILIGTNANRNPAVPADGSDEVVRKMRQEGVDPAIISQVQQQVLGRSSPEAAAKFDDLLGGFLSGKLSVGDIRSEAQKSIAEIKSAKQELPEIGDSLDGYLAILEKFVGETATNEPAAAPAPSASAQKR